jgi:predicted AlkP superfamily pyrophosphatase or phosphodiesterase
MSSSRKLLVVNVAGLGWELVSRHSPPGGAWTFQRAETIFPAVTCAVQASFRTATPPRDHGMIANGLFFRDLRRVMFWEQSAALVVGSRIWEAARQTGKRVGMLFWQQSLGESVDLVLTPKPIHQHHGGMIQDCYSRPPDLYDRLCRKIGRPFHLTQYWGPLASVRVNEWIVEATCEVMRSPELAPDLLFTYLPGLDYDLQRYGPDHRKSLRCLEKTLSDFSFLWKHADDAGYDILLFGDYNIESVTGGPVFPNRRLREVGLLATRVVRGRAYPDFFASEAFAIADHQVAPVCCADEGAARRAAEALRGLEGVGEILDAQSQREAGLDLARSGDLTLVARKGYWFAYPWWVDRREAPDYATHVDIHNKPGYDPCELFFGWPPLRIGADAARVRGTHGRRGPDTAIAWASSRVFEKQPATILDLAHGVKDSLQAAG